MSSEDLDLEERQLCPDGACIGVIGADGKCNVCGRSADGAEAATEVATATVTETEAESETEGDVDRQLCPDGACIGLIGPDGRCKVCGLRASS